MHFLGSGSAHHLDDFPASRTPNNRIINEHDALTRKQVFDGIQLHFDSEMPDFGFRLDECAANVMVSDQPEREWDSGSLRVTNGGRYSGVGDRNDEIGVDRALFSENASHQIAACLYRPSKHDAIRTREIHMLENAFRQLRRCQSLHGFHFAATNQDDFAGFDFAQVCRSD